MRPDAIAKPEGNRPIVNRMSLLRDHSVYWENDEQFVMPLLRELDVPESGPAESRFYTDAALATRAARRVARVEALSAWWYGWMAALVLALAGGLIATLTGQGGIDRFGASVLDIPVLGGALTAALQIVPGDATALVTGLIATVALFFLLQMLGIGRWDKWDEPERCRARRRERFPAVAGWAPWLQGYMFLVSAAILVFAVLSAQLLALVPAAAVAAVAWLMPHPKLTEAARGGTTR